MFNDQLGDVSVGDVLETLWLGFRISLKTAGIFVLLSFVLSTIPRIVSQNGWKWYSPWTVRRWIMA